MNRVVCCFCVIANDNIVPPISIIMPSTIIESQDMQKEVQMGAGLCGARPGWFEKLKPGLSIF